jgi:hypothetical protein
MGVFPYLRSLHLDVWCHSMALTPHPPRDPSSPRTRLTALSIHPYPDVLPLHLAPNPEMLSALQSFVGVCQHVATLPHPEVLETLDLTGASVSLADLCPAVTALARLSLSSHCCVLSYPRVPS